MKKYIEVNFLFLTIIVLQLLSCAGTNYKKLSLEDPNALIAIEDSLLSVNKNNQSINDAIVIANNSVAKNYLNSNELSLAVRHFKNTTLLSTNNILLYYYRSLFIISSPHISSSSALNNHHLFRTERPTDHALLHYVLEAENTRDRAGNAALGNTAGVR